MKIQNIKLLVLSAAVGISPIALSMDANATTAADVKQIVAQDFSYFTPRPKIDTRLDFSAWDYMLSESVLYMGPSTRRPAPRRTASVGSRLSTGNKSRLRLEGNKILYPLMNSYVKSEFIAYKDELIELGNTYDIPSIPKNEQLAYWINLHNAVVVSALIKEYPGPRRQPSLIQPIKGSDLTLHDAKLINIKGYALSLRDIREKIVFPNWKNKDVAFAFHLGYQSSPSLSNSAYEGRNIDKQIARNAYEFFNSLRAYEKGTLNPYVVEVSEWYFPNMDIDFESYMQRKMRPEVFAEFSVNGIKKIGKPDLSIADMTAGHGTRLFASNLQTSSRSRSALGPEIDDFLTARSIKFQRLEEKEWYRRGTVTIEDTTTDDEAEKSN